MNSWTIRLAEPEDSPGLAALAARTFPAACPPEATTEEMADHIAAQLSQARFDAWDRDPSSFIYVAQADTGLIGYVLICLEPEEETPEVAALLSLRPACELSKCYVDAQAQGTGVAAELVDTALHHARSLGVRSAWLGVNVDNARAISFYGRCGFVTIGPRRYVVGGRVHRDHLMQLDLNTLRPYEPTTLL